MQRIESERAALRRKATQNNEEGRAVDLKSDQQGRTLDHVAASLGISRDRWYKLKTAHYPRERENSPSEPPPANKPARYSHAEPRSFGWRCKLSPFGPDCSTAALRGLSVEMC